MLTVSANAAPFRFLRRKSFMFDRRAFLKATAATTGATTGAVILCTDDSTEARKSVNSPSGVGGYNYRLPVSALTCLKLSWTSTIAG